MAVTAFEVAEVAWARLLVVRRRVLVRHLALLDDAEELPRLGARLVRGQAASAQLLCEVVLAAADVHVGEHEPALLEVVGQLGQELVRVRVGVGVGVRVRVRIGVRVRVRARVRPFLCTLR